MVLFKNVTGVTRRCAKPDLKLEEVQIGGLGGGPGRKAVNNAITLDRSRRRYCFWIFRKTGDRTFISRQHRIIRVRHWTKQLQNCNRPKSNK